MEGCVCSAPHSPTTAPLLLAGPMCTGRGAIRVWDHTSRPFPPQVSGGGGRVRKWRPGRQVARPWRWGRRRQLMAAGFHGDRGGGRGDGCRDARGSAGGERWRQGWWCRDGGADPLPGRQGAPRSLRVPVGPLWGIPVSGRRLGVQGRKRRRRRVWRWHCRQHSCSWRSGLLAC